MPLRAKGRALSVQNSSVVNMFNNAIQEVSSSLPTTPCFLSLGHLMLSLHQDQAGGEAQIDKEVT